jgi:outer membrane protein assembly factor BamB
LYTVKCTQRGENNLIKVRKTKTIAILLIALFATSIIVLPQASAQTSTKRTYAFLGALPNPVGIGQEVLLHFGIPDQLSLQPDGWEGITITVKDPDGITKTLGPFRTDSTGGSGTVFVPDKIGNYTMHSNFPEQVCVNGVSGLFGMTIPPNTVMQASQSEELTLTVQEEQVSYYPGFPLPTEYWSRPFDAQHREWAQIAGSWLETPANKFAPYNQAPETAHILWTTPFTSGGTVGGALDNGQTLTEHSYDMGDAYEGKFGAGVFGGGNPLIIAGKLYYEKYAGNDKYKETACVDLHTGKELWSRPLLDNRTITRGQLMYWDTYDYHGVYDYLISAVGGGFFDPTPPTWNFFDPFTGDWVYSLVGIPTGSMTRGEKGEFLIYTVNTQNGWMTLWNSTNIPQLYASTDLGSMGYGQWQPMGKKIDATGPITNMFGAPVTTPNTPFGIAGYHWNKTIPNNLPGSVLYVLDDRIIGGSVTQTSVKLWGLSRETGTEGQLLFSNTWNAPSEWSNLTISTAAASSQGKDGLISVYAREERKHYAFSTETGQLLWETDDPEYYLNIYSQTVGPCIAYDKYYSTGAAGIVYCYDTKTGDLLWQYHANDPYNEILWANDWWLGILFISDGKIYVGHEEHSPIDPRPRGAPFICLNATTGEEIWRIDGAFRQTHWGGHAVIGDSIIATQDTYDQRVYGIGKGPSSTTITASPKVTALGSSIVIEGTVMDVSPGTNNDELQLRFPNGVPAMSDASQSDWMLYVYKQFERPMDATGVSVTIDVVDANGNYRNIGTTTSDSSGIFAFTWKPDIEGSYTVIATFAGSKAFYASYAQTTFAVDSAAPTPEPTDTPLQSTSDIYFAPAVAAIIAAIAIGFAATILILRKKP